MTRREPPPQPKPRSRSLQKGTSTAGTQNLLASKKCAREKGTALFCGNSQVSGACGPGVGLQNKPTIVRARMDYSYLEVAVGEESMV